MSAKTRRAPREPAANDLDIPLPPKEVAPKATWTPRNSGHPATGEIKHGHRPFHWGAGHLLFAAVVTVARYLALALSFGPFVAIGGYWAYLMAWGPLIGRREVMDAGLYSMIPMLVASCVCIVVQFTLVLPTITSDGAREVGHID